MSNKKSCSFYQKILKYQPEIKLHLHTPAHQGVECDMKNIPSLIYLFDRPYFPYDKLTNIERKISKLYSTKYTFISTGGASQGVLAICLLLSKKHRNIAISRNCHLSLINGLILSGLKPIFIESKSILPTIDEIIHTLTKYQRYVNAIMLTSPDYEGRSFNIEKISLYCRNNNIDLIIDEAHGSHFPLLDKRLSTIYYDVDIVLHSLHKYIGSLAQTSLIHLPKKSKFLIDDVQETLNIFQTTTRSNILILSIEEAIERAFSKSGSFKFLEVKENCNELRIFINNLGEALYCENKDKKDPLKLFIASRNADGKMIAELYYKNGIDCEYYNHRGVLFIFSYVNTEKDFCFFKKVTENIYCKIKLNNRYNITHYPEKIKNYNHPKMHLIPREAFYSSNKSLIFIKEAVGCINCSIFAKCPPGVPLLIPGEEITDWHINNINPKMKIKVIKI